MERRLPSGRVFFRKSDLIVVALLVAAGLSVFAGNLFLSASRHTTVQIYSDNRLFLQISLPAEDQIVSIPDKQLVLQLKDNRIGVLETGCPDQICKKTGEISRPGQSIICLPNRVVVQITGQTDTDSPVDAIAG